MEWLTNVCAGRAQSFFFFSRSTALLRIISSPPLPKRYSSSSRFLCSAQLSTKYQRDSCPVTHGEHKKRHGQSIACSRHAHTWRRVFGCIDCACESFLFLYLQLIDTPQFQ